MASALHRTPLFGVFVVAICLASCGPVDPAPADDAGRDTTNNPTDMGNDVGVDVPARPAMRLRFATFNVARFFDTVCDSNNCGDSQDYERQYSDAEFAFKADQITTGIEKLDADIVTLAEVENDTCLDALVERNPDYTFAELGEIGGTATVDVAVMARGMTHIETRKHRADTELHLSDGRTQRFAREFLEEHFDKDGQRIVVFAAHFKAQRNDDPAWRLAEATAARQIAEATQAEFPDAFVYIGGDLNDEPGSPPLDALTSNGGLIEATRGLPADEIWTYAFVNTRIAIDHLLYVPADTGEVVDGTAEVVRDASGALGGSDHAGLRAEFDIFTD